MEHLSYEGCLPKERTNMKEKQMRELDSWTAEHVMGWAFRMNYSGSGNEWHDSEGCERSSSPDSYTTDPAAAMQVLEKCSQGQAIKVWYSTVHKQWACADDGCFDTQYAATLPLAICLFAKKLFEKKGKT